MERYVKAKGKNISSQSRRTREPDHDYANTISFDSAWDFLGNHQGDVCVTFYRFFSVCVPVWVGCLPTGIHAYVHLCVRVPMNVCAPVYGTQRLKSDVLPILGHRGGLCH